MRVSDLQTIADFAQVPILSAVDPQAKAVVDPARFEEIAEAADTVRLFDLLHRQQYHLVAIIRVDDGFGEEARAYFTRRDCGSETKA
ncbi:MAG TPA: hypothetical protein VFG20_15895 [Planctomycetaceae bacterium]|jgi:hypothetical protein|nr:hypothetical protein [Planctomycetaceae bacterium]